MSITRSCLALVALGALAFAPSVAEAGGRFGTDRGSRYHHGYHGHRGGSRSYFDFSIGFGSGGYHRGGFSYTNFRFGTHPRYGGYYRPYCPPAPVVVYPPPPVVYTPPPAVVYTPAPSAVYVPAAPQPIYTSPYYYSSGGYYCGR